MHPACALCRGACCESLVVDLPTGDLGRWLGYHGRTLPSAEVELAAPCRHLETCGTCAIWEKRPAPCHVYTVGGADCRATIARRRPAQAPAITALLPPLA